MFTIELQAKRLGILHELVPSIRMIAHLVDPNFPPAETIVAEVETAARNLGRQIVLLKTSSESDIDAAFESILRVRAGALLVGAGPFFNSRRGAASVFQGSRADRQDLQRRLARRSAGGT